MLNHRRQLEQNETQSRPSWLGAFALLISSPWLGSVSSLAAPCLVAALCLVAACEQPADICAPIDDRIGFFSQGDCVFTRAPFFRGHEWITSFGNAQLSDGDRFGQDQIQWMALGNRRVDYPKELWVHLDNGVLDYVRTLTDHTEQPEVQPHHFLLGPKDTEKEAAAASRAQIFDRTLEALELWTENRTRALTLLGQAQHAIQDSFSSAHTVRRRGDALYGMTADEANASVDAAGLESSGRLLSDVAPCRGECSCILRVKAYNRRASGYREGVLYHGTDDDTVGHITSQDSIYRSGRDCHRPESAEEVWGCLNEHARQGVQGTAAYLLMVRQILAEGNVAGDIDHQSVVAAFDVFARDHLSFCDDL